MKKLVCAALLSLPVSAVMADNDVGCGLGTQIWEGQSGLFAKVLAATTNGTSGNQTFGITSGTLGCSQGGVVTAQYRVPMFAGANFDQLAADVAAGEGETLDALATLYEVPAAEKAEFAQLLQANYDALFSSAEVTAGEMLAQLDALLAASL